MAWLFNGFFVPLSYCNQMCTGMRLRICVFVAVLLMVPMGIVGQDYKTLWKQVEEAQNRDLPQTAIGHLKKIAAKAKKENAFGQLLKSTLLHARLQAEIAPDSLRPAVAQLEQQEKAVKDVPLRSVYDAVLSLIYKNNRQLSDDYQEKSRYYAEQAMAHPDILAAVKTDDYVPFVVKGKDSRIFGHDLLSVIGMELNAWQQLHDYYAKAGHRQAACLTAVEMVNDIRAIDSLIAIYGDLPEACELAIKRYGLMRNDTPVQKAAWLKTSLQRWGSYQRANSLRNSMAALTQPRYQVELKQRVMEVNKSQMVYLRQLCHLQHMTMSVYRTRLTGENQLDPQDAKEYQQIKAGMSELKEMRRTLNFTGREDYEEFEDSLQLEGLSPGVYLLEFSTQPQTEVSRMLCYVSGLRLMTQAQPDNSIRYVVVDATTGQPVGKASLRLKFNRWTKSVQTQKLTCDEKGEVVYHYVQNQQPEEVYAFTPTDVYCPVQNAYGRYTYYEQLYNREHTSLFTDRSVYRPGQTVQVTAIVWREQSALDNVAVADKQIKIELRDANYRMVSEQTVTTNRFGKCTVPLTLPVGLLNGRFTIRANNQSCSIRVEEYKRPTFQVEFADCQQAYRQGDTVRVQGKAMTYAGVPVQGGKVKYSLRRKVAFWWHYYAQEESLGEGETTTADDGSFTINVPMFLPSDAARRPMFYHFVVDADVTDQAGETHHGMLSLPLGNRPTALSCDLAPQVRKDQLPQVTFSRLNAAGKEIAGTVSYRLDGGKWKQCAANASSCVLGSQMRSGEHLLEAICEQDTLNVRFVVFGLDDKKPAKQTDDWFYVSDQQFASDGTPVTVQVGSSDPNIHIVYGIYAGNQLIESGAADKDAALVNRQFTYKETYGNGILLTYAWIKNGQCHTHQAFIRRPLPDKKLKMTWETFRDRLTPGQKEEWRLKIQHPDGSPADASLMAVLYDKSLDAIVRHQWSFVPENYLPRPSTSWYSNSDYNWVAAGSQSFKYLAEHPFEWSRFDNSVYPYYRTIYIRGSRSMLMAAAKGGMARSKEISREEKTMMNADAIAPQQVADEMEQPQEKPAAEQVQVRENLNETAFCYPLLETDKDGHAVLKFTLPESLTTWRFMGVANTVDMLYGNIEGEAIAQKELMVQPNIPRFLREGDEAVISMRITNTGQHMMKNGTALLRLDDVETEVLSLSESFEVEAGKTIVVSFRIPGSVLKPMLYTCKVSALAVTDGLDGFSDGEQHYLPVLSDKEYVTKTIPYTQHEPGVKTFDLTNLFPAGTTQQKLTVEYTNNPVWLMVQSLPVVGQPWEHSAIDQAASYYSNSLAKMLLAKNPQVKAVFEQWKREDSSHATLHSSLEKNQELKDLVLNETPWVAAADRDTEQKQRLADFFDENGIGQRLTIAVEKLNKLQRADGSFSWYPGMQGSTQITVAVLEMLVRLDKMTGEQSATKQMQQKAFDYVGQEMVKLVNEMKKAEKKGQKPSFPSFTALRWLYLCALDGRHLTTAVQSANNYLIALMKKDIKRQTIYEKALTAVILAKHGEHKNAAAYVQSLKEYSVFTEEMGRYYDTPRATYSWYDYKIPTEVAAIEAIQLVTPKETKVLDEMRRWLLQEKRTQAWDTPINSVNAIWAFMANNTSQVSLTSHTNPAVFAIDGSPINQPKATAGLGYVKTAISQPQGKTFTANKTSEGTSWGAVYAQFFQKTSEVEAAQSGIKVKREIISLTSHLSPLTSIQVGDRVKVRITIESSRDLDFVQVIDRRAACMEPVNQLSGYRHGAYVSPKDAATHYFFNQLTKGKHVIETTYYVDRAGRYESGTCTVGCAYAPEYRSTAPSISFNVQ